MKTIESVIRIFTITLFIGILFSCDDEIKHEYTINEPVYMSTEEFKNAVKTESSRDMEEVGKIYFYQDFIFVNEKYEGVHIIDNSDPSNPKSTNFINIPGNIDIAIKDDVLYADSYTDLIAIDISDVSNIDIEKRFENIFPWVLPPTDNKYRLGQIDPDKGVVVGWEVIRINENYENLYIIHTLKMLFLHRLILMV
tara:strand:- start:520 stop:1107 length:588 start_codon:yes stop_codon:yes gene_type:complete